MARGTAILLLIVAAAAGVWYGTRPQTVATPSAAPPSGAAPPPPVTVAHPIARKIVEWDEFTGQFNAVDYVELRARVSGYLTEIHFEDGQTVKKGDLLFVIDSRPFQADLRQAEANLERDKAQVVRADLDLRRYTELAKKNFAPQQQFEQARATAEAAAATVKGDEAAVAQARLNVEFTRITAPVGGRIGRHEVSLGNLVLGGSTPNLTLLTTIVTLDPSYFYFDMSESDYLGYQRSFAKGLMKSARDSSVAVALRLADEKGWPHQGHMDFVNNQIDISTGTIRARAIFANPDLLITPGQFARIRVPASEPHQAILIPDSAILSDQSRKIAMTVKEDGTVAPRVIVPGPLHGDLRVIRSGLAESDVVVVDGVVRARPGAKVTPQQGKIEASEEP